MSLAEQIVDCLTENDARLRRIIDAGLPRSVLLKKLVIELKRLFTDVSAKYVDPSDITPDSLVRDSERFIGLVVYIRSDCDKTYAMSVLGKCLVLAGLAKSTLRTWMFTDREAERWKIEVVVQVA
jgi:hypothetical protein